MPLLRKLAPFVCVGSLLYACGHSSDDQHTPSSGGDGGSRQHAGGAGAPDRAGEGGAAGTPDLGGASGKAGEASEGGAAGAAGAGGDPGLPIAAGLVVVSTTVAGVGAAEPRHFIVLIDPLDGHELARTQVPAQVLGMGHEARHDRWFVFTGNPGQSVDDPNATLLVGAMTSTGFQIAQTATVPKPTNQNTIALLNERILYRISTHAGLSQIDDTLLLLDTSSTVKALGKLIIPWKYSLVTLAGAPTLDDNAGGRVFFLHDNLDDEADNCMRPDAGSEEACTIYTSSLMVSATDRDLSFQEQSVSPVTEVDHDGSDAALGVQPSGKNVVIVAPPRRAVDTRASVHWYDAQTGESAGPARLFSLESETKKLDPTQSITLPGVTLDPCSNLLFTGELANAALLYAVGIDTGAVVPFDPKTKNGIFGGIAYEPYTRTLIDYDSDTQKPTFLGFEIDETAGAPSFVPRNASSVAPWSPPAGLVPEILVVKNPVTPPCGK